MDPGRRPTRNVSDLAESIKQIGLLNPVTITEDFRLVAGGNRLAACASLGWTDIPAVVCKLDRLHAELAEIDENLIRNELSVMERAEQLSRRKEIYEAIHPETRHGFGPGRGNKRDVESTSLLLGDVDAGSSRPTRAKSFIEDTSLKTGRSKVAVARDVQIAKAIPEPLRAVIRDTPLADNKTDLLRLARLDPAQQELVVQKVIESPTPLTIPQAQREVVRAAKRADMEVKAAAVAAAPPTAAAPAWDVIHGDCVPTLAGLEAGSVRLVFADPPYNIGVDYGQGRDADLLEQEEYIDWCQSWIDAAARLLTDDGSMWIMIGDEYADLFGVMLRDAGLHRRSWIKWYESFGVNCSNNFNRCSRHLFYCVKDAKRFVFNADAVSRPSDRQVKYGDSRADPGGKVWDNIWGINPPIPRLVDNHRDRIPDFPTQLPIELLLAVVGCASEPGDLILDPFNGSGTTGAAALRLGRRYLGIEKESKFAGLARMRLSIEQGKCHADAP